MNKNEEKVIQAVNVAQNAKKKTGQNIENSRHMDIGGRCNSSGYQIRQRRESICKGERSAIVMYSNAKTVNGERVGKGASKRGWWPYPYVTASNADIEWAVRQVTKRPFAERAECDWELGAVTKGAWRGSGRIGRNGTVDWDCKPASKACLQAFFGGAACRKMSQR